MKGVTFSDPYGPLVTAAGQQVAGPEPIAVTFSFGALITEMQEEIKRHFDMPTLWSFRWTCRLYCPSEADNDFDCYGFADKCAELGYVTLLQYSFERGGPWDHETNIVAAQHGQVKILEMVLDDYPSDERKNLLDCWSGAAAEVGCYQTFSWLAKHLQVDGAFLEKHVEAASKCGNTALALEILKRVAPRDRIKIDCYTQRIIFDALARRDIGTVERIRRLANSEHMTAIDPWQQFMEPRRLWKSGFSKKNIKEIFDLGVGRGNFRVISWCVVQDSTLLKERVMGDIIRVAIEQGDMELLEFAEQRGGKISIDDFRPSPPHPFIDKWPHIRSLKYLHGKFNLSGAPLPFQDRFFAIPDGTAKEDVEWLAQNGYRFQRHQKRLSQLNHISELIPFMLKQGIRPDISVIARGCRIDLLNHLWLANSKMFEPDDRTIRKMLEGTRLRPRSVIKTMRWLLDHGFTTGLSPFDYDRFIDVLLRKYPKFFRDHFEEIHNLNLPLSQKTKEKVEAFLAQKTEERST